MQSASILKERNSKFHNGILLLALAQAYHMSVNAAMNDLKAMHQMRMYKQYNKLVVETCIDSWMCHTCYLTEELTILCLADDCCPYRNDIKAALLEQEVLDSFHPRKPKPPLISESLWPEEGSLSNLSTFIGPRSYLFFSVVGIHRVRVGLVKV